MAKTKEWSGSPDARDPDNFWIDDETGERVNAVTGERLPPWPDRPDAIKQREFRQQQRKRR